MGKINYYMYYKKQKLAFNFSSLNFLGQLLVRQK